MVQRFYFIALVLILPIAVRAERSPSSCKREVTNNIKFKIIKDSLEQIISLYPNCGDADENSTECTEKDTALAYMDLALDTLKGYKVDTETEIKDCPKCPEIKKAGPVDCLEVKKMGNLKSGVYTIYPKSLVNGTNPMQVYCDMETDRGGWTVIQRRANYEKAENFHVGWQAYKKGFGNIERDFWLGNENIYTLTNQGVYSLRIDLRNKKGEYRYSFHDSFWIGNEASAYAIRVRGYSGTAGDDLATQDGRKFSTKDRQNDGHSSNDACAHVHHGAWWYSSAAGCGSVNLNGLYMPDVYNRNSAWWFSWPWQYTGIYFSEMKIRHRSPEI